MGIKPNAITLSSNSYLMWRLHCTYHINPLDVFKLYRDIYSLRMHYKWCWEAKKKRRVPIAYCAHISHESGRVESFWFSVARSHIRSINSNFNLLFIGNSVYVGVYAISRSLNRYMLSTVLCPCSMRLS